MLVLHNWGYLFDIYFDDNQKITLIKIFPLERILIFIYFCNINTIVYKIFFNYFQLVFEIILLNNKIKYFFEFD